MDEPYSRFDIMHEIRLAAEKIVTAIRESRDPASPQPNALGPQHMRGEFHVDVPQPDAAGDAVPKTVKRGYMGDLNGVGCDPDVENGDVEEPVMTTNDQKSCPHTEREPVGNAGMIRCKSCGLSEPDLNAGPFYVHERTMQKAREMAERGEIREEISAECDMPMHIVDVLRDLATARATVERVVAKLNEPHNNWSSNTKYERAWAQGYAAAVDAIRAAIGGESK